MVMVFPESKRLVRQLLQIPFAILTTALLGTLIVVCFGIEVFISEVYDGPGKSILVSCDLLIYQNIANMR